MYYEKSLFTKIKIFTVFALIPLIAFMAVVVGPFVLGIFTTFTNSNGISLSLTFKGFENYLSAITDFRFWQSLALTFKYVIVSIVFINLLAFGLALLVTSRLKAQNFFRLGFFTPNLIGGIILGLIWQFIFARVLVYLGQFIGSDILSSSWLAQPESAFWALVIVGVWQSAGYMMLIYIAGLMGIDSSLLEMAQIDGATKWQQLMKIKIPLLIPSFTICLFLTLQRSFMVYDTNLALTQGGPFRSTELISMHVYNEAFLYQHYGSGQAKAFILFIIVAFIAVTQVKVMKKMEVDS